MTFLAGSVFSSVGVVGLQMQHTPGEQTGYVWMFILMAATPYFLLFVIGGGIFRARRRQREREVEAALEEQQRWELSQSESDSRP